MNHPHVKTTAATQASDVTVDQQHLPRYSFDVPEELLEGMNEMDAILDELDEVDRSKWNDKLQIKHDHYDSQRTFLHEQIMREYGDATKTK